MREEKLYCGLCKKVVEPHGHMCIREDGSGLPEGHLAECPICGVFHEPHCRACANCKRKANPLVWHDGRWWCPGACLVRSGTYQGTVTGRVRCSEPNLQNVPVPRTELGEKIKKAFRGE